jgi:hypothetical protein
VDRSDLGNKVEADITTAEALAGRDRLLTEYLKA